MNPVKLIVGLGNPGPEYEFNRHNIGQLALDQLTFFEQLSWQKKFKGLYAQIDVGGEKRYFLKPLTYMNLSGESVCACQNFFKLEPHEILIVHDELDLEFGTVMLKKGGGLAGHNGLKSIAQLMGSQDFLRLRLGISRPTKGSVSSWVLSDFSKNEQNNLEDYLKASAKVIESVLDLGFEKAAGQFSRKSFIN